MMTPKEQFNRVDHDPNPSQTMTLTTYRQGPKPLLPGNSYWAFGPAPVVGLRPIPYVYKFVCMCLPKLRFFQKWPAPLTPTLCL